MICLVASGFGFGALKDHPFWGAVAHQVDHVAWEGTVFWDLIQPAFMFMVGVSMPFSFGRRESEGAGFASNLGHVLRRALIFVCLSNLFTVVGSGKIQFGLINVLSQMAFTYLIAFLVMQLAFRWQVAACAAILAAHWGLFLAFPGPAGPFSREGNIGQVIDKAVLGWNYSGLYVTINFMSSAATTLFGVWTGYLLRSGRPHGQVMRIIAGAGAASMALGLALTPWSPLVKRIWTTSFTFYSAGWVLFMLLGFYWLVEVRGHRRAMFPLLVVGANSIFAYCVSQMMRGSIHRSVGVLTGKFEWVGTLAPVFQACATLGVIWYLCYWLYQRKVFIKV
jgi:predicted acyltransferase